jgi:hypothetical protein
MLGLWFSRTSAESALHTLPTDEHDLARLRGTGLGCMPLSWTLPHYSGRKVYDHRYIAKVMDRNPMLDICNVLWMAAAKEYETSTLLGLLI